MGVIADHDFGHRESPWSHMEGDVSWHHFTSNGPVWDVLGGLRRWKRMCFQLCSLCSFVFLLRPCTPISYWRSTLERTCATQCCMIGCVRNRGVSFSVMSFQPRFWVHVLFFYSKVMSSSCPHYVAHVRDMHVAWCMHDACMCIITWHPMTSSIHH